MLVKKVKNRRNSAQEEGKMARQCVQNQDGREKRGEEKETAMVSYHAAREKHTERRSSEWREF